MKEVHSFDLCSKPSVFQSVSILSFTAEKKVLVTQCIILDFSIVSDGANPPNSISQHAVFTSMNRPYL